MTVEKPLHVKVAEALGCKPWHDDHVGWRCGCGEGVLCFSQRYGGLGLTAWDTDWSATGPIIEKYGISVYLADGMWSAQIGDYNDPLESLAVTHSGDQKRPLVVVCELLMLMAATGKLKAA